MFRLSFSLIKACLFIMLIFSLANFTWAQSETATVSGQVVDPSGLNVTGAQVKLVDIDRDTGIAVATHNTGLYTFPSVRPGRYRMEVTARLNPIGADGEAELSFKEKFFGANALDAGYVPRWAPQK